MVVDWRNLGHTAAQLDRLIKQHSDPGSVTELDLSENALDDVPRRIVRFTSLQTLRLNDNKLSALPSELCQLKSLTWLNVQHNQLDAIPASLTALSSLSIIRARGNPELPVWLSCDRQIGFARTQQLLVDSAAHFAPLESACRAALYAFLIVARTRSDDMRRCFGRDICKLIGRMVWKTRGSARVWAQCLSADIRPLYLFKSTF